eukprot:854016-Pyramimonas_sp.AAC.1
MSGHRCALGSAILTRQRKFATIVLSVCAPKRSSSKCQSLPSQTISGSVAGARPFRAHLWAHGCCWGSEEHVSANSCWVRAKKRRCSQDSLATAS